jgi:hypothetical protein
VSRELSADAAPCPPRVFLLVFDQSEGRDELFAGDGDWLDFFAHLSELYNTLPNVVVLFTMTLGLRNRLHTLMERQFRDRIRMDEHFVLRPPTEEQVLELYRSRVAHWLSGEPALCEAYRGLENPYEPFDRRRVLELAGQQTVREVLEAFDGAFHGEMSELVVEPEFDFHYHLNELRPLESVGTEYDYTLSHLETVRDLLAAVGSWLAAEYGVALGQVGEVEDGPPSVLRVEFTHPANDKLWVKAIVARLTYMYKGQLGPAKELLAYHQRARYFLYLVRAKEFDSEALDDPHGQVFKAITPPALESRLKGLMHLAGRRDGYERDGQWAAAQDVVRKQFAATYLHELFLEARRKLELLAAGTPAGPGDGSEEPAAAGL